MAAASKALNYYITNAETKIRNELYALNEGQGGNNIQLTVQPKNQQHIELHTQPDGNANAQNYTMALVFKAHLLDAGKVKQLILAGNESTFWSHYVDVESNTDEVAIYLLDKRGANQGHCALALHHLFVNANYSSASNMELRYRLKAGADPDRQCQQIALNVLSRRGQAASPFRLWLDSPKLSTKKGKKQSLKLRLLNSSGSPIDIGRLRLVLQFDVHNSEFNSPEALMTATVFKQRIDTDKAAFIENGAKTELKKAEVNHYLGTIYFELTGPGQLEENQQLKIQLKDFEVYNSPGQSPIKLSYYNLPGFWDGSLETTVARTAYMEALNQDLTIELQEGKYLIANKLALDEHLWVRTIGASPEKKVVISRNGDINATGTIKSNTLKADSELQGKQVKSNRLLSKAPDGKFTDLVPPGTIVLWSGTDVPNGWALCDGKSEIDILEKGRLKKVKVPDLSGRFVVGKGKSKDGKTTFKQGTGGGAEEVTLKVDQMPSHNHSMKSDGEHSHRVQLYYESGAWTSQARASGTTKADRKTTTEIEGEHTHHIYNTGGSKPHPNLPPYFVLAYIIKR